MEGGLGHHYIAGASDEVTTTPIFKPPKVLVSTVVDDEGCQNEEVRRCEYTTKKSWSGEYKAERDWRL